jgi:hypothetical protein
MRFKLGYVTGFATGYYLGSKAGRQRYDQINRSLRKLRKSDVVEKVAGKAKETVQNVLPHRSNGHSGGVSNGANVAPAATTAPLTAPPTIPTPPSPAAPGSSPYSSSR